MSYRKLLAEDNKLITYRPSLRPIGGSVAGTILLQQIIYWDEQSEGKFYKFTSKCSHEKYKKGDSWEEELGMSPKEIATALAHFAFKCGKKNKQAHGDDYESARESALVTYYTDSDRVTWYSLNSDLLNKLLLGIYKESDRPEFTYPKTPETTSETTHGGGLDFDEPAGTPISGSPQPKKRRAPAGTKVACPPTIEEVKEWAESKGHPVSLAEKAFQWYERIREETGASYWTDANGSRVKCWKQKIARVWMTPEKIAAARKECGRKRAVFNPAGDKGEGKVVFVDDGLYDIASPSSWKRETLGLKRSPEQARARLEQLRARYEIISPDEYKRQEGK